MIHSGILLRCEKSCCISIPATFYSLSAMMSEKMIGHINQLAVFLSAFAATYFVFGAYNKLNYK